ncbi:MAG: CTP synthetase, partial [Verrucomicrobiota bacterium]
LGMQIATIEYARNVCQLKYAHSTEFDPNTPHPVVCLLEEQTEIIGLGATMRLGSYETRLRKGTKAFEIYKSATIRERHRHRYEFNQSYRKQLEDAGLVVSGVHGEHDLAEVVEIPDHPFYMATQFHPEFLSKPNRPHPLFDALIKAAVKRQKPARKRAAKSAI